MTVPFEYKRASADFDRFLLDAREATGLTTTNQVYTTVQGVLQAFRRRLTVQDAIAFAQVLPPVLRALFVADWDVTEKQPQFTDRATMVREVQALRPDHNFATDTSIEDIATALRKNVDAAALDVVLARLPPGAREFWAGRKA